MQQAPQTQDSLAELRTLLLNPEQTRLLELQERLDDPNLRAHEISDVLPQALSLRSGDMKLTAALTPMVQEALQISAKRNPRALVEALFPVIGPAIRKSIAETFAAMLQSLNQVLDRSLSIEGMKWRIEAMRTGRSFGEVAILRTLVYRVEQVFLIHQESGLLLQHVVASAVPVQDAEVVSGMLSAIRDFAHDSFRLGQDEALDSLKLGPLKLWMESGPQAYIVAVIRGDAPMELRSALQAAVERIHRDYALSLANFDGDTSLFEAARPELDGCLSVQYVSKRAANRSSRPSLYVFVAIALILAAGIALYARNEIRWSRFLNRLKDENGIVVVDARNAWFGYSVTGLRDPLAADPQTILREIGIPPGRVQSDWRPFQSAAPEFVLSRAGMLLRPPQTAHLAFKDGVLSASGQAPDAWLSEARRLAFLLPGVVRYEESGIVSEEWQEMLDLAKDIENIHIAFSLGSATPGLAESGKLAAAEAAANRLLERARSIGAAVRIEISGYTDPSGGVEENLKLAEARATVVAGAFERQKVDAAALQPRAAGSGISREVTFHVQLGRTAASGTGQK